MKIYEYISDLLFRYDCVVVPGFGGFITNYYPAEINHATHMFRPPSKRISFNIHLKHNDGLLANHLAAIEKISYKEAVSRIEEFVQNINKELTEGKRVNINKIGKLYFDAEENVQFNPSIEVNYLKDSFGMNIFRSPAIRREESDITETIRKAIENKNTPQQNHRLHPADRARRTSPRVNTQATSTSPKKEEVKTTQPTASNTPNQPKAPKKSTPAPLLRVAAVAVPLIALAVFGTIKKDWVQEQYVSYTNLNPFSVSHSAPSTDEALTENPVEETTTEEVIETPVVKESTTEANVPVKTSVGNFHIIAGAFRDQSNANRLVASLKAQGFGAQIVDTNSRGLYRVAYQSFGTIEEARRQLSTIKSRNNSEAWLLAE